MEQRNAELAIINSVQQGLATQLILDAIYELVAGKLQQVFPDAQTVLFEYFDLHARTLTIRYYLEKGKRSYPPPTHYGGIPYEALFDQVARSREPIMEPIAEYERIGFFGNVVFTNGHVVDDDELTIYYGASDSVICGAQFSIREILGSLSEGST